MKKNKLLNELQKMCKDCGNGGLRTVLPMIRAKTIDSNQIIKSDFYNSKVGGAGGWSFTLLLRGKAFWKCRLL